jgi:quinohemoprotein ethanol dehydrogenase
MSLRIIGSALLAAWNLTACSGSGERSAPAGSASRTAASVDEARLAAADSEPHNWYSTHRAIGEDHYSPLASINSSNVHSLGLAWEYGTGTTRGLEASPIVIDGVMYTTGSWSVVYALDAETGRELWKFDPKVPGRWARNACCDVVNRGVAAWKGRIYVGTLDGRLIALDAATGREIWSRDTFIDREHPRAITGAPRIAAGKVIIGFGGADLGARGYISAYDAQSGELSWRFFTVPGDPREPFEHPELEQAARTWDPASLWQMGGGGTAYDAMAYDPRIGLLYVGTGNGSPHPAYDRSPRGGDNLFLASILAIDPGSGRLVWHYQTTPAESWDYTATQQLVLADLEIRGERRSVIMQAPKNGFFYVLDRRTGELLSAQKYGKVNWASHVDLTTGRPALTGLADYSNGPKLVYPGERGAHNWHPMSFSARTGLVYIPLIEIPMVYSRSPGTRYARGRFNFDAVPASATAAAGLAAGVEPALIDHLVAWDPVAQEEKWRVPLGDYDTGGGVLSTAGDLVFQGNSNGFLEARAADTGALLTSLNVGTGIMAAPVSYAIDGVQYVAVMAGMGGAGSRVFRPTSAAYRYGNDGRILTFKLNGGPVPLPQKIDRDAPPPEPPAIATPAEAVSRGRAHYRHWCISCHSGEGRRLPGLFPNLFTLSPAKHAIFQQIVRDGVLEGSGMAGFADVLSERDVSDIQAYLVHEARELGRSESALSGRNPAPASDPPDRSASP